GDDVGQELALDLRDLVLEQQLSLFEALQLELVEGTALGEPRDHLVEVAMLALQGGELCFEGFYVKIHGLRPESSLILYHVAGRWCRNVRVSAAMGDVRGASSSAAPWLGAKRPGAGDGGLAPASYPSNLQSIQVENPAQRLIDHLGKRLRLGVKGRNRRRDHRTHLGKCGHRSQ